MDELCRNSWTRAASTLRVDREQGVLRGVKLLGLESRNGRKYLPDGARAGPRPVRRGPGERQPSQGASAGHAATIRTAWAWCATFRCGRRPACSAIFISIPSTRWPSNCSGTPSTRRKTSGFSHNVQARTVRQGDETLVEAILKVHSVDLVADPATTCGLVRADATAAAAAGAVGTGPAARSPARSTAAHGAARPGATDRRANGRRSWPSLRRRVDELQTSHALGASASSPGGCWPNFACPIRTLDGAGASWSASRSWNRCWPRPTSRRCGNWWPSGRGWFRRRRARRRSRAAGKPMSREQGSARRIPSRSRRPRSSSGRFA